MNKVCSECGESRPTEEFYFIKARQRHMNYCKFCHCAKINKYRAESETFKKYHDEYQQGDVYKEAVGRWKRSEHGKRSHRELMRRVRKELKLEVFSHYCNGEIKCQKCGFSDIRALTIDHINGDGAEHRRKLKHASKTYSWLRKNNYPDGFQVLCMNCQFIKKFENKEHSQIIE